MNVNDVFLEFDLKRYLHFLNLHPEASMIMADVETDGSVYPAWKESGLINLNDYLKKTFLDEQYLEFNSIGVLHQHVYRTRILLEHHIRFNPDLPRTTDRIFTAEAVKSGGGLFYYASKTMVSWRLTNNRYHFNTHHKHFNFGQLWINEYEANKRLAEIADIDFKTFIKSQLIYARFLIFLKSMQWFKHKISKSKTSVKAVEVVTSPIYYQYLKVISELEEMPLNFPSIDVISFKKAFGWLLVYVNIKKGSNRSIKDIIKNIETEGVDVQAYN